MRDSDVKVREIRTYRVPTVCRTPLKFGAVVVEDIPIGYVQATVENRAGQVSTGWGAMFLMDLWAWPTAAAPRQATTQMMWEIMNGYAELVRGRGDFAHPIDIFAESEEDLARMSRDICGRLTPGEEVPFLGALIAASPVDHALHDAFGNVNAIDSYLGYGPEHMSSDVGRHLGPEYVGVYPSQFLRQDYLAAVPIFHLVGGVDTLERNEVGPDMPDDGVPNSLDEWIERDGVFCLKVKLRGNDTEWDVERTLAVSRIYHESRDACRGDLPERPVLTTDFNEQCQSPEYVIEYLTRVREQAPEVFDEILYIEQPTERDLEAHAWDMRPLAALKPVLIDESLASANDFRRAMELGWSGIALKSCKCLSADLLLLCAAEMAGVPYAVQDLTNPSIALVESIGLAARIHTIKGVEANSRQFFPEANRAISEVHSGICAVRDGYARTESIRGTGLGFQIDRIPGFLEAVESAADQCGP
jgi:L-alanine-DL-glutamate epimerase-like enolase superfamily enzyme